MNNKMMLLARVPLTMLAAGAAALLLCTCGLGKSRLQMEPDMSPPVVTELSDATRHVSALLIEKQGRLPPRTILFVSNVNAEDLAYLQARFPAVRLRHSRAARINEDGNLVPIRGRGEGVGLTLTDARLLPDGRFRATLTTMVATHAFQDERLEAVKMEGAWRIVSRKILRVS